VLLPWSAGSKGDFGDPGLRGRIIYAELLDAYGYAQMGLDENPVEVATSRAKAAPPPELRGSTDERIRLVAAMCRERQPLLGDKLFFCRHG
jgi:hypothetical protein